MTLFQNLLIGHTLLSTSDETLALSDLDKDNLFAFSNADRNPFADAGPPPIGKLTLSLLKFSGFLLRLWPPRPQHLQPIIWELP